VAFDTTTLCLQLNQSLQLSAQLPPSLPTAGKELIVLAFKSYAKDVDDNPEQMYGSSREYAAGDSLFCEIVGRSRFL
jgi:hypothetical protein